jgi:hypothetical protein
MATGGCERSPYAEDMVLRAELAVLAVLLLPAVGAGGGTRCVSMVRYTWRAALPAVGSGAEPWDARRNAEVRRTTKIALPLLRMIRRAASAPLPHAVARGYER